MTRNKTMRPFFALCCILLLQLGSLEAQPFSLFEYKNGKNAIVYPLENFDEEEAFLMVFKFESYLDMVFLTDDLALQRIQTTKNLPGPLQGKEVQAVMNSKEELHLFISASTHKDKFKTELLSYNKSDGSYKRRILGAEIPEMANSADSLKLDLVKVFQYEQSFYKLWVDTKTSSLYVFKFDIDDPTAQIFKSFENPLAGKWTKKSARFGKRLGRRMVIPVPLITDARDASVVSNAKEEKIYKLGSEILISVENQEEGSTDLVVINTDTWEVSSESYLAPNFLEFEPAQKLNSFIYEGFLYQVLFNSTGLHLYKVDFSSSEIVFHKTWTRDDEFYDDFALRRMRQMMGSSLRVNEDPKLWQQFKQSLAIVIHPEETYERLMIGSHRYTNQRKRDIINTIGAVAAVGADLGAAGLFAAGNAGNIVAIVDPFASVNLIIDATYYLNEGRIFQGDCLFNPETFRMSSIDVKPSKWDKIMERIDREATENNLHSISLFERKGHIYFGYWKKREYYLVEF